MKKWLAWLCAVVLLTALCPLGAAETKPPVIKVEDQKLKITYNGPGAADSACVYMLLDEMERVALVEMNLGDTWLPDWEEEGLYKVRVYYLGEDGTTKSVESDWKEVRFTTKSGSLFWQDFLGTSTQLPSSFTKPVEYNEATPAPTWVPVPASERQDTASQPQATPAPAAQPTTAVYAGTKPCFDHIGLRIRISDNDAHSATKGRSGPGTDTPQVATLNIGEVYVVLDCRIVENGNVHWFMVNKNGVNCWVASGRCERINY